jgi:hypothetical protein
MGGRNWNKQQVIHKFRKHYTRDEARELLPLVKQWLDELCRARELLAHYDEHLSRKIGMGDDLGGEMVNKYVKTLAAVKEILKRFQNREIQVKDLDRGLIDFPAFVAGREVFLCWERGEDDIEFWHDLTGYAGREKL